MGKRWAPWLSVEKNCDICGPGAGIYFFIFFNFFITAVEWKSGGGTPRFTNFLVRISNFLVRISNH